MSRVAGIVSAGALITFAATPAALAQTTSETPTTPSTTETTSETPTTTAPPTSETTPSSSPVTTTGTTAANSKREIAKTTTPGTTTTSTSAESAPPKDDYQDNTGHGFVGLGGEGVLVIACAAGRPGGVATQYLSVTGGPDQDEADGRLWNYTVRVVDAPAGTTTAKFSWTCGGVEGNGIVDFEQVQPPTSTSTATSTVPASSTAPVTTATSSSAPAGNAAPKAQVKVAPKGGVETGFGGTAR